VTTEVESCCVLTVDADYVVQLAVALRSLSDVIAEPARAVVFSAGVSARDEMRVRESCPMVDVEFIDVESRLPKDIPVSGHQNLLTYARLLIPEFLRGEATRALYVDADVLFFDDPAPLFSLDLGQHPAAAVADLDTPTVACPYGLMNWRELGLDPQTLLFNAGVLMIDVDAWRAADMSTRILAYARAHPESNARGNDQDALNAVVRGGLLPLKLRWNAQPVVRGPEPLAYVFFPAEEVDEAATNPGIVHFAGWVKPWEALCTDPLTSAWRTALLRTSWADWRPFARPRWHGAKRRIKASARALLRG
jgi:lipopolysaccharide biosynthesis glycosyltransferase